MTTAAAPAELITLLKRAHVLGTVEDLLGWDEQVNLPPGAAEQRAEQRAVLAEVQHAAASDSRLGELLAQLERQPPPAGSELAAVLRQARRDYDRATKLPPEFVREKAAQGSRGYHAWARAKAADDFAGYAPVLEANLALARQEAAYLGHGDAPYDYLLDRHDPGMTAATVERLFGELRRDLVPLATAIVHSPAAARAREVAVRLKGFPIEGQREFLREVTAAIGFDYDRGRIDVSLHPFCSGTGSDVRMTTRFNPDQPLDALFSSIHETGHGLYEQGLPAEHLGTALGMAAGMAMHESQSRLWKTRSRAAAGSGGTSSRAGGPGFRTRRRAFRPTICTSRSMPSSRR